MENSKRVCGFEDLTFTRTESRKDGLRVFACYPGWNYEYSFIIVPDGKIKGKTSTGNWLELSAESGRFIRERAKAFIASSKNS